MEVFLLVLCKILSMLGLVMLDISFLRPQAELKAPLQ